MEKTFQFTVSMINIQLLHMKNHVTIKQTVMKRYYPVKDIDGSNRIIYNSYKQLIKDNVTFIGRCGMYVYVDMHQAINSALIAANKFLEKKQMKNIIYQYWKGDLKPGVVIQYRTY